MNYRVFIIIVFAHGQKFSSGLANQAGKIVLILPDNLSGAWPLWGLWMYSSQIYSRQTLNHLFFILLVPPEFLQSYFALNYISKQENWRNGCYNIIRRIVESKTCFGRKRAYLSKMLKVSCFVYLSVSSDISMKNPHASNKFTSRLF